MMSDNLVAGLAIMLIFGAPIAAWIVSRVLVHQERMEMIRRGVVPPPGGMRGMPPPGWQAGPIPPPQAGKRGVYPGYEDTSCAQRQLRKGITVAFVGLAIFIGLSFIGMDDGRFTPGPWLIGGLVPTFVGIAQIINALLNGAQLPSFGAGNPSAHSGNFGPPPPGPPPQTPAGPYAWRPGPTPEIEPPSQPPQQR